METKVNETASEAEAVETTASSTPNIDEAVAEEKDSTASADMSQSNGAEDTASASASIEEENKGEEENEVSDAGSADDISAEVDPMTALENQLEAAQAEAKKNMEGWQRAAADLANVKRRQEEQAGQLRFTLTSSIVTDVLAALDDLDLAFQHLPEGLDEKEQNWVEGFSLVQRKLHKVLDNNRVEVVDTTGEFDPNLHEAVTYEPSEEHESNAIIGELRKGYKIGNRILRPALVRVAK